MKKVGFLLNIYQLMRAKKTFEIQKIKFHVISEADGWAS